LLTLGEAGASPYPSGRLLSADLGRVVGRSFRLSEDGFEVTKPTAGSGAEPKQQQQKQQLELEPAPAPAPAPDADADAVGGDMSSANGGSGRAGGTAAAFGGGVAACAKRAEVEVATGVEGEQQAAEDEGIERQSQGHAATACSSAPVCVELPSGDPQDDAGSDADCVDFGGGQWGTPVKGGREQRVAAAARAGVAAAAAGRSGSLAGAAGIVMMRRMNFEEISRMISSDSSTAAAPSALQEPAAPLAPQDEGSQQGDGAEAPAAAAAGPPTKAVGLYPPPPPLPLPPARDLAIAAAVADAEAAAIAGGGGGLVAEASSDFSIGAAPGDEAAPDVGPRPPSGRASWRGSRTTIDQVRAASGRKAERHL
jgi:hypothetical protein